MRLLLHLVAIIAAAALGLADRAAADPPPVIYVLAGQSNMLGYDDNGPNPAISPGVSFADEIAAQAGARPLLVQCAVSSSEVASWQPGASNYQPCVAQALTTLAATGGVFGGLLFWQGETEGVRGTNAATWSVMFSNFVTGMRASLGVAGLPVVFAQLDTPQTDPVIIPFWSLVQDQQVIAAALVPHAAMVVTADQPTLGMHVTAAGQVIVGRRFATAMLAFDPALLAVTGPQVPPLPPAPPAPPVEPVAAPPPPHWGGGAPAPVPPAPVVAPNPPAPPPPAPSYDAVIAASRRVQVAYAATLADAPRVHPDAIPGGRGGY